MDDTDAEHDRRQINENRFDDMIDKICAGDSPWSYEEAVHIASDMWDAQEYTGPVPSDYVPIERRRHMTGGA